MWKVTEHWVKSYLTKMAYFGNTQNKVRAFVQITYFYVWFIDQLIVLVLELFFQEMANLVYL